MTFVKDNKIWLIKDVSVVPKSKREFFWKKIYDRMYHRNRSDIAGSVLLKTCFDGIMISMRTIIPSKLFSKENKILIFMRVDGSKQMI